MAGTIGSMVTQAHMDSVNLRLALNGLPLPTAARASYIDVVAPVLARQRELRRELPELLCPADRRIQAFIDRYLGEDSSVHPRLPDTTLTLDEPGLARALSLPVDGDDFSSDLVSSYRVANGVLHNPRNDRRTTAGVFHVAEGGLAIPDDKKAVPIDVFARLLDLAFQAPPEHTLLPYTSTQPVDRQAHTWVSLLLRPLVVPEVPGFVSERRMEIRFFAPGGLVSNLDFVEGIFGNSGDPLLPVNDSALAPSGWTGHSGCIILAPHLNLIRKVDLGLPHVDQATDRQRRDGMCWSDESELYNEGKPFKLCARDESGVILTIVADNYFGYCKKEVKTQISYSANLFGLAEEEHSGGARAYISHNEGQEYATPVCDQTVSDVVMANPDHFEMLSDGQARVLDIDDVVLVPGGTKFSLRDGTVSWDNGDHSIRMRADTEYISPAGYRIHMVHNDADDQWYLEGTYGDSTTLHKCCTVSGGGKSEISKAISDTFLWGNAYSPDFEADMDAVDDILHRDYSTRFADPKLNGIDHRPVLSTERSVGSVIKLLTPSSDFTDWYNDWINSIPAFRKELVFTIKRYYKPEWGDDWRSHFSVAPTNGRHGNMVRLDGQKVLVSMARVGFQPDGSWRLFTLRHDYAPAVKVQTEDDMTASIVTSPGVVTGPEGLSRKVVANCEALLFQRPDDAIYRGYDTQTERDMSGTDLFISNYQPLTREDVRAMRDDVVAFSKFTPPMRTFLSNFADSDPSEQPKFVVSSADPRLIDGVRSRNPRYLQVRPDIAKPRETAIANLASHLYHGLPIDEPLPLPVDVVAAGRRNNPPEGKIPALCAYNPLHYMELPELFMEFISSMTGKSPSTTGAGSEGALTKAPFNALPAVFDLNSSFLSFVLSGYDGWLSSAGFIGPKVEVAHDISLLVPEIFCRMSPAERDAKTLIEGGYLEKLEDYDKDGELILASRLGYRMTEKFMRAYFGRIFLHPDTVFTPEMLRPELQDADIFADSVRTISTTHARVAKAYFDDGTVSLAVPPIRALLEIMVNGVCSEGWTLDDPELREMFTRESVLASDWYAERIDAKQAEAVRRAERGIAHLEQFMADPRNASACEEIDVQARLDQVRKFHDRAVTAEYRQQLVGTLGRQVNFR
ncbi:hypothetical protein TIA1EST31_11712 [Cutibacterium acnes FZ1/2/0]|jgi:phosphoenolpyruvate carboxykinase (diphosphate)|uniref:PPi-type phosphoenolpyruvate carboxykinase lobe 2 domain-containing protein n=14 Tax=Bacteria TaxID=2 RepID=A0ABM7H209_CUTAC|nr:hypothetical protein PPA2334 [Cutibacterium acnes KPA171202]ADE01037.1 hypothetical protein HMPREF0675_5414 [Cutibacterium acnes SK137]AEE73541.1 hypothetical protein PAZ_c24360 [Cutibacterium acnes 266]AEH30644.1 hypothetical protein TIB1ST10_11885 [Cutibacterium acnes 6609]AEW80333.1 hypothetical protein TIA2EST2_11365 [Cutibacterium acnes TypeIA2 P.acn33]AEW82596.1 hypothetical protein TIA2EST22_11560 [Cutibacterium acnes TypeIA2 P.acn17]AEW84840.1 hypothetical protein TIA2EST36_11420 [